MNLSHHLVKKKLMQMYWNRRIIIKSNVERIMVKFQKNINRFYMTEKKNVVRLREWVNVRFYVTITP